MVQVFVEFIQMGRIIGRKLQDMPDLDFVYYFGDMSVMERDKSVKALETQEEVKVMVRGWPGLYKAGRLLTTP